MYILFVWIIILLRNDAKRIFVLGAGSSISHTKGAFPDIAGFLVKARKNHITVNETGKLKVEYKDLSQFIQKMYGEILTSPSKRVDIEEVFTHVQFELVRNNSVYINNVSAQIKGLIQKVLLNLSAMHGGLQELDENSEYSNFVDQLGSRDTVMTYNWDTLLDYFMKVERRGAPQIHNSEHRFLGNEMQSYGKKTSNIAPPYSSWDGKSGFYLKMHGSIDWFSCTNKNCRAFGITYRLDEFKEQHYCGE